MFFSSLVSSDTIDMAQTSLVMVDVHFYCTKFWGFAPFLSSEIYSFQGTTPVYGVGSLSILYKFVKFALHF